MKKAFLIAIALVSLLAISILPASAQQAVLENIAISAKLTCPFYTIGGVAFAYPNMDTSTTVIDFRSASYAHGDISHIDIGFIPFRMWGQAYLALPSISQCRDESIELKRLSIHLE